MCSSVDRFTSISDHDQEIVCQNDFTESCHILIFLNFRGPQKPAKVYKYPTMPQSVNLSSESLPEAFKEEFKSIQQQFESGMFESSFIHYLNPELLLAVLLNNNC